MLSLSSFGFAFFGFFLACFVSGIGLAIQPGIPLHPAETQGRTSDEAEVVTENRKEKDQSWKND